MAGFERWEFRRTRLAPSPTGALHLGHARTFLVTWWLARQAGAEVVMRMEDLDVGRAKEESVREAYEDLRWLGMDWDEGPAESGAKGTVEMEKESGAYVQSQRLGLYAGAIEKLWREGAIFPCTCTRADIAAAVTASVGAPQEGDAQFRYGGTCRPRGERADLRAMTAAEAGRCVQAETHKRVCWRLRVEAGAVEFEDKLAGRQRFDVAAEVGDFPLTRFEGPAPAPAYQLACVVDDHAMGIDAVIRGGDLLSSTPRQILLYRALGYEAPTFGHVPLVIGVDGKRLAKRHGESRIAEFRERGVLPEKILGWVAWRSGQLEKLREISAGEITSGFDLKRIPREPVVLDAEDLRWLR